MCLPPMQNCKDDLRHVVREVPCASGLAVGRGGRMDDGIAALARRHACGSAACAVTLGSALFIQFSKKVRLGAIVVYCSLRAGPRSVPAPSK